MGRVIAIDYGQKRTGIAVTDTLQLIANGMTTIPSADVVGFLSEYFQTETVDTIVVGYPRRMNNSPSPAVKYIDPFLRKLKATFPEREIVTMDERFTSKMAAQSMIAAGAKKKTRQKKELIDKISATILLQSYLEMREIQKKQ